jgi:hypothetical protein
MSDLIQSLIDKETGLTEREQYFLDVLFEEAGGDFEYAMKLAGYPKNYPVAKIRRQFSKQIKQLTKDYLVSKTPKAAIEMVKVFQDPSRVGTQNIIKVAQDILDRGDVNKEEAKYEMPENVIILLPPKKSEDEGLVIDYYDEGKTETN